MSTGHPSLGATAPPRQVLQVARGLRNDARVVASAQTLREQVAQHWSDEELLEALQLLRRAQQDGAAADILSRELARGRDDARLHAMAGNIAMSLGHFESAREHLQYSLQRGIDLNVWYVGQALAHCQRYRDRAHPDLQLFEGLLARPNLDDRARVSLYFARAKFLDDINDLVQAAQDFRLANATLRRLSPWRSDAWQQLVQQRLRSPAPSDGLPPGDFQPIFVVGLPRSGTTLVAERLNRWEGVRGRGEPPLLEYIARQLDALGSRISPSTLQDAAELYARHLQEDDEPAQCYVDKNPLNFLHLDTAARLFPQARVIVCRRAPRDCAVSIWMQFFAEADYGFANDFADIRRVHDDFLALLQHWRATLPLPMLEVHYERLVDSTRAVDAELGEFLNLSSECADASASASIGSASMWQARQPVYRHAIGRGDRYAELLPDLRAQF